MIAYEPDDWCVLDTYPDRISAEIDAGFLNGSGVAARVDSISDFPGQERGARLIVDSTLAHRARWLLKLGPISEAELEFLATGKLPDAKG
jgi:hypothetical protein